jgi:hemolysin III
LFRARKKTFVIGALGIIAFFIIFLPLRLYMTRQAAISVSYVYMAALVLTPAFLLSYIRQWEHAAVLVYTLLFFGAAVAFRVLDFNPAVQSSLPMGTHFLWHLFGSACAFFMLKFVYETRDAACCTGGIGE